MGHMTHECDAAIPVFHACGPAPSGMRQQSILLAQTRNIPHGLVTIDLLRALMCIDHPRGETSRRDD